MNQRENGRDTIDLASIRSRLAREPHQRQWRGLDELAETREFKNYLHNEFPPHPAEEGKGVTRRDALKLMGASAGLAGLSACTKLPTQKIVPYVRPPEEVIPGKPLFYATAMPLGGFAAGVLVESHMGRPTKVEGNPDHPASLGATDAFAQASVLTLYDPDRSQVIIREGRISSWGAFVAALTDARTDLLPRKGAGLRILTETITSPTLADQIRALLAEFPQAKWHQYEPTGRDAAREGSRLAFGEYLNTVYRFDQADVILSLDADFLCSGPGAVRYARDFAARRRVVGPDSTMNRLYVVESTPSNTGAMADHRLPLRSAEVAAFAAAIAEKLGVKTGPSHGQALSGVPADWIPAIARDLLKHRGASLVVAGDGQPPAVHALAHAMNVALGNAGKTVIYTDPVEANPVDQMQSLRELVEDIKAGQVDVLLILSSNPAYTAPADMQFAENLLKVKLRVHLGLYDDETAELCHWHIPEAHYLESWGDARAYDGTVSILQPLIAPLYDGKSAHEVLAALQGHPERNSHDIVQAYWKAKNLATPFEPFWETSLHNGLVAGTSLPPRQVSLKPASGAEAGGAEMGAAGQGGLEIVFRPDPTIHDGRFANNGWLQELPKPFTKLTWDNAAMVSPQTAERLSLNNEDVVELRYQGRTARAPVWIMPGHANESITLHLGYGRRRAGKVGTGIGFNAYSLRPSSQPWFGSGLEVRKTGERYLLARTQHHHAIERNGQKVEEESLAAFDRELVRVATLEEFRQNPEFAKDPEEVTKAPSLYAGFKDEGYAWGMAIDLNSCTGCNACVVACQSENNISVVGKAEVHAGREMHWIRIDTYYQGSLDNPAVYNEPVLCMQCENAPCEVVCPVGATVHSAEGLNQMVYNRCVGTRYCSNNCPYKVRRFNFKLYSDWTTPSLVPLRNPNVTVRSRGVMEKCTYCVQRISAAKIEAEKQDRTVRDGEITTACEGACPSQAIVFGNINDPASRVSRLKAESRNYGLLADLNTRPRTTYLARLRNPNPEIKD
jgi:MoCo/4Fe-4S cofactor protein with predicted Tat translocation signal